MRKRLLGMVLVLVLCLTLLPGPARTVAVGTAADDPAPDNDGLFYGYLLQRGRALLGAEGGAMLMGSAAGSFLEELGENEWAVYSFLAEKIRQVADGTLTGTVFEMTPADLGLSQESWTAEELGVSAILSGGSITEEAQDAMAAKLDFKSGLVLDALLADFPYELYWYDKTVGMYSQTGMSFSASSDSIGFGEGTKLTLTLAVAGEYAAGAPVSLGGKAYNTAVDAGKLALYRVTDAVAAAAEIVSANAGKTDFQKLTAYKDAICEAVSYNDDAADDSNDTPYGNPWQLIYVFDGDESTRVVCEGYSKAFQYLCDLSTFAGDIRCYSVSGNMGGGTGAGAHMWNIVHMSDGKNYLVDVTNCDAGTVGAPDLLFFKGYAGGSDDEGYVFSCGSSEISYTYDDDTALLWSDLGILSLSGEDYDENAVTPTPEPSEVPEEPGREAVEDTYEAVSASLDALTERSDASPEEILTALDQLDAEEVLLSLRAELSGVIESGEDAAGILENLGRLEEQVLGKSGGAEIAAAEDTPIDAGEVAVTGAALNAAGAAEDVRLLVGTAGEDHSADIPAAFAAGSAVPFSMTLEGAENAGSLRVPVTLSVPLPDSFRRPENVRVLHFGHGPGGTETLVPRVVFENGKLRVVFAVRGFSDFAFVELAESSLALSLSAGESGLTAAATAAVPAQTALMLSYRDAAGRMLSCVVLSDYSSAALREGLPLPDAPAGAVSVRACLLSTAESFRPLCPAAEAPLA